VDILPLPQATGRAIVDYLRYGRPPTTSRVRPCAIVRQAKPAQCRQLLGVALTSTGVVTRRDKPDYRDLYEKLTGKSLRECPVCHRGQMVAIAILSASNRAPLFAPPLEGQLSICSVVRLLAFPKPTVRSRLLKESDDNPPPGRRIATSYTALSS
jgi:hypothetical protein